jgi:glycosyltransferase involved in cell wall biosynthesis
MSVSVIIPTYNRPGHLGEALDSILAQSTPPQEVLVVDDSTDERVSELVGARAQGFSAKGVSLRYMRNPRERSAAIARNVGLEHTGSEIVLFMDDDVVLGPGYMEAVLSVYRAHPDAVGVQGHMAPLESSIEVDGVYNTLRRAFSLTFMSERGCEVLRSFKPTYPVKVDGVERCSWLSGTNQSYRRSALSGLRYDENLKRYSLGEDIDLSFNVAKRAGGALYITSSAIVTHKESQAERTPGNRLLYVEAVHSYYLFRKNMPRKPWNTAIFLWSRVGRLLLDAFDWVKGVSSARASRLTMRHLFMSQVLWISRRAEIASGDISFLERYLRDQGL